MIPPTEHLINWFWAICADKTSAPDGICQCATDKIISESNDPDLARAFMFISIAMNRIMRGNPYVDYRDFVQQFRFPRLLSHPEPGKEANESWVLYSHHMRCMRMNWKLGAALFCQLANDLRTWLSQYTGEEMAFQHFALDAQERFVWLFEKNDRDAANSIKSFLQAFL